MYTPLAGAANRRPEEPDFTVVGAMKTPSTIKEPHGTKRSLATDLPLPAGGRTFAATASARLHSLLPPPIPRLVRSRRVRERGIAGAIPILALAGLLFTASAGAAGFDLGDASSYGILQSGKGGRVTIVNSTISGNIAIGSQNRKRPSLVASNSLENGKVDFASLPIVTGSGSTITGAVTGNVDSVNSDYASLAALSTALGAIKGAPLSISLSGGSETVLASGGFLSGGNRVFDVSANGFVFNHFSTLIIDGQNLGQSVVLNFKGFGAKGWGLGAGNIILTGGLTPDRLLWNTLGSGVPMGLNSWSFAAGTPHPEYSFSGIFLDPLGQIDVDTTILHGRLYGGNDSILITDSRLDSVPEPSAYALFGLVILGLLVLAHHRRRKMAAGGRTG